MGFSCSSGQQREPSKCFNYGIKYVGLTAASKQARKQAADCEESE